MYQIGHRDIKASASEKVSIWLRWTGGDNECKGCRSVMHPTKLWATCRHTLRGLRFAVFASWRAACSQTCGTFPTALESTEICRADDINCWVCTAHLTHLHTLHMRAWMLRAANSFQTDPILMLRERIIRHYHSSSHLVNDNKSTVCGFMVKDHSGWCLSHWHITTRKHSQPESCSAA